MSSPCVLLTWKAIWPEKSYIPQECMRLSVFRTASELRTRSPVIGQIPPLARVAAIMLPDSQVTSMEQSCHRKSLSVTTATANNRRLFNGLWLSTLPGSRSPGHRSCQLLEENTGDRNATVMIIWLSAVCQMNIILMQYSRSAHSHKTQNLANLLYSKKKNVNFWYKTKKKT